MGSIVFVHCAPSFSHCLLTRVVLMHTFFCVYHVEMTTLESFGHSVSIYLIRLIVPYKAVE